MRDGTSFRRCVIVAILTVFPIPSVAAEGWEPGTWEAAFYAGLFDTAADSPSTEAGLEVRRSTPIERLAVLGGITANDDGGAWIYGGGRYDLHLGSRWTLAPGFAVSLYEKGDGKELGHTIEFRSSIELARRVSDRLRVGFVFYHLSNASISETNPGANSAVLNFAFRPPRSNGE